MKAKGLVWMGLPTDDFEDTVAFFRDVMSLEEEMREEDFAVLRLPVGETVEVFGPSLRDQEQFATGPVVGFLVDDASAAREEMEARGVDFVGPVHVGDAGRAWAHFRGPGGKAYEITKVPESEHPPAPKHRLRSRPTGALRLAFRLPIYLYRLGLGRLFGRRFLLVTHQGRKSGRVYQTMLEVVRYDPSRRETVVVSGWGEKSDWYRNLKTRPALEVQIGGERYVPEQRFLTPEGVYKEIVDYERRHPWTIRIIVPLMGFRLDGSDTARRTFADSLRTVAFRS